ncbi:MAG: hypothetical protein JSW66_06330 [Phycisphaerales bacterium]|nr:MAG: hypothetical protein JSW66_06330 [Phycisphaerales bacterium]
MSYARLNIWLRDLNCCPKNVWKMELVVKTCGGEYLADFNPDVIDKLREAYPDYKVERGTRDHESTIRIEQAPRLPTIKHIEVNVPPGCYIVRAWVCWGNLWTDRAMVIVSCGGEACVNLIVPRKVNCIRDVLIPVGIAARDLKLPPERVRVATEVLMATGQIQRDALRKELTDLAKELKEAEAPDAPKYVDGLEFMAQVVKGIRLEQQ